MRGLGSGGLLVFALLNAPKLLFMDKFYSNKFINLKRDKSLLKLASSSERIISAICGPEFTARTYSEEFSEEYWRTQPS